MTLFQFIALINSQNIFMTQSKNRLAEKKAHLRKKKLTMNEFNYLNAHTQH